MRSKRDRAGKVVRKQLSGSSGVLCTMPPRHLLHRGSTAVSLAELQVTGRWTSPAMPGRYVRRPGGLPGRGGPPAEPREKQLQKALAIGETVALGSVNAS